MYSVNISLSLLELSSLMDLKGIETHGIFTTNHKSGIPADNNEYKRKVLLNDDERSVVACSV